jgi:glycosyltransferase involved in cell wall biosynthesis
MPKVSVIVPNYNHARYLRKRLESVLAQTFQDFELILLDDCSSDNSREVLNSYANLPNVRIEFNERNSGSTFKQWNKGVRMARGEYVWIAESDDFAEPRFLERLTQVLDEDPEVTFAFCRSWRVTEENVRFGHADFYFQQLEADRWGKDFIADGWEECRRSFVICAPVPNASAVLLRKAVYEKIGGAGDRLHLCSDYQLWVRMALQGKVAYVGEELNSYRSHENNVRTQTDRGALSLSEYFYAMRWVIGQVAPAETLAGRPRLEDLYEQFPAAMTPEERLRAARRAVVEVADWNLRNNANVPKENQQAYFRDWEFALIGKEFEFSPPSRWEFFRHRLHFYQRYSAGMTWKWRAANLMRLAGAPLVGYRRRHWPEAALGRLVNAMVRRDEVS